ncbi:MAG: prepilin-type N-terminal cleavage/methylation domain-containing protein [Patescibacteria group bacterium]|nr:prepilin-type N-terminal cleavage/methylation domain-containing protein [Patescibacteria group bacterium]
MRSSVKSGFTLIEVLIYTAMVGLVMLGVIMLASVTLTVRSKVRASIILEENYRFTMSRITTMVNQAEDITSPLVGTNSEEIVLSMKESALSPTVINVQDGVIYVQQGVGQPMPLTSEEVDIQDFQIFRVSSTAPMVRMVVYGKLRGADSSYPDLTVTTTAVIRK